jgi:hypothetical protein
MAEPLYQLASKPGIHRGDIYRFRPIPWLAPPVWLVEHADWTNRRASMRPGDLASDFRDRSKGHQELVLVEAKLRFVIVLYHAAPGATNVSVAPVYSFADHKNQSFLQAIRQSQVPDKYYLPEDESMGIRESYADLVRIQPMHRAFLTDETRMGRLSSPAWQALLVQYSRCLAKR